uniref:uncharacterized protein LOC104265720 n=1 Tax=Ciona intestinalis TaxID=7719 RepID=UPI0005211F80|nr:uncharacterized protein LOC104265720 [Ciona intestinalis]|eukprot:XP_009858628.1 uncharacterized protein LOC104265720 [Ciona intestinalis]
MAIFTFGVLIAVFCMYECVKRRKCCKRNALTTNEEAAEENDAAIGRNEVESRRTPTTATNGRTAIKNEVDKVDVCNEVHNGDGNAITKGKTENRETATHINDPTANGNGVHHIVTEVTVNGNAAIELEQITHQNSTKQNTKTVETAIL